MIQSFKNLLNQLMTYISLKKKKVMLHKILDLEFVRLFDKSGNGTYLVSLKAAKGFVSGLIGLFSNNISHTVIVLYSDKLKDYFDDVHWTRIKESWDKNYGNIIPLDDNIKALVIASADQTGMECFDFAQYQNREMSIRKLPTTFEQDKLIVGNLANIVGKEYDFTGLLGWLFRTGDDGYSWYCSEACYDVCSMVGITVAEKANPTPGQIETYEKTQSWKVFDNMK